MTLPTFIPYPNVPAYPGVPQLVRPVQEAIAEQPLVAISLGTIESLLGSAFQQAPRWGIFDSEGEQLGLNVVGRATALQSIGNTLLDQLTGNSTPVLSTVGFDFLKEMRVSDFPVEQGGFASYNKVELPGTVTCSLAFAGTESDRTAFLAALDAAEKSTGLYSVVTPEVTYVNYTIERYRYSRRAFKGATLLLVDVALKEVRQVSAAYTTVSPIVSPQNTSATPQVNSGMTQPQAPDTSTLLSIYNKITGLAAGSN